MATFDTTGWLNSLVNHFTRHPSLLGTVSAFEADEPHFRVGGVGLADGQRLAAFARWLASMRNVSPVTIFAVPGGPTLYTHLHAAGQLADGHVANISVTLQARDVKPLVGRIEIAAGSTFQTALLLELAGVPAATDPLASDEREPDDDAVLSTDRQIDAVAEEWSPGSMVALSAAILDGPCDDEPMNAEHGAELEQAIGRPIPDIGATTGGEA